MLRKDQYAWVFLRLGMGWIFLWAFLDKLLGLGFSTAAGKSWLAGVSPTFGFLSSATHGPFAGVFQGMAGSAFVDWLFMLGLLLVGTSLILGIGIRIAAYSGSLIMLLMWLAALPPKNNPFLDDHVIYLIILLGLSSVRAWQWFGFGSWWSKTPIVKKYPLFQ